MRFWRPGIRPFFRRSSKIINVRTRKSSRSKVLVQMNGVSPRSAQILRRGTPTEPPFRGGCGGPDRITSHIHPPLPCRACLLPRWINLTALVGDLLGMRAETCMGRTSPRSTNSAIPPALRRVPGDGPTGALDPSTKKRTSARERGPYYNLALVFAAVTCASHRSMMVSTRRLGARAMACRAPGMFR